MATIVSSNPNVVSIFSKMEEIIVKEGGFIHPNIRIVEKQGNLIVESSLSQDNNEVIFSVPESCLFDTKDTTITLTNNDLVLSAYRENITNLQKTMCELMLSLFNHTNKIAYHQKTFPIPLLNNSQAFNLIDKKCPGICAKHKTDSQESSDNQLLVKTFLGCRQLNINLTNKNNSKVLMPFIDSLNHHIKSTGIDMVRDTSKNSGELQIKHSKPMHDSNECFVNYGPMDPMVRYFHFGYIDTTPYQLQSAPVTLDFSSIGKIFIMPFNAATNETVNVFPDELQDIQYLLPKVVQRGQDLLIWRLYIPIDSNHNALRRILEALIVTLAGKKLKRKKLEKHIKDAETKIISENRVNCKKILTLSTPEKLDNVPEDMIEDFAELANLQLALLDKYQQKAKNLAFSYL